MFIPQKRKEADKKICKEIDKNKGGNGVGYN